MIYFVCNSAFYLLRNMLQCFNILGKDYKLVCRKKPFSKKPKEQEFPSQLLLTTPGEPASEPKSTEPESKLLPLLTEKGLTQKQSAKFISEKDARVIISQFDYLPFRLEEYKAQGREINEAAILHDSIKDNWKPPEGYLRAEKQKEKEVRLQALRDEHKERVKKAKAQADEWAARTPEDRISALLESWIWGEKHFDDHEPTEEEIEAKKAELISYLPTREEYEQQLIGEIERDIRDEEQRIRE